MDLKWTFSRQCWNINKITGVISCVNISQLSLLHAGMYHGISSTKSTPDISSDSFLIFIRANKVNSTRPSLEKDTFLNIKCHIFPLSKQRRLNVVSSITLRDKHVKCCVFQVSPDSAWIFWWCRQRTELQQTLQSWWQILQHRWPRPRPLLCWELWSVLWCRLVVWCLPGS